MKLPLGLTTIFMALFGLCHLGFAADTPAITWTLEPASIDLELGKSTIVKVELKGIIPAGFHIYSQRTYEKLGPKPTGITLEEPAPIELHGDIEQSPPIKEQSKEWDQEIEYYHDKVTFTLPIRLDAKAKAGPTKTYLVLDYQLCNAELCLFQKKVLELNVNIKGAASKPALTLSIPSLGGPLSLGGPGTTEAVATWSVSPESITLEKGGAPVALTVKAKIPAGAHIYSLKKYPPLKGPAPTKFALDNETVALITDKLEQSEPIKKKEELFENQEIETYEGEATFTIPLKAADTVAPGEYTVKLMTKFQICDKTCRDRSATLPIKVVIQPNSGKTPANTPNPSIENTSPQTGPAEFGEADPLKNSSLASIFWTGMAAGGIALFTPCVFPMIPITVSFFTKRKNTTRIRTVRDAAFFSLSIIVAFTLIGLLCSILIGASGAQQLAANAWVNLVIASVFFLLALNLFGAFELAIPTFLVNKLDQKANEGDGLASVLLMGVVFAMTSFTCSGPFVGTVLVAAANGQWFYPLVGMFGFALVFSAPFFVLALFPAALKALPKAGGWLNSVKVVMGFLELAAALKFVSNADLTRHWGVLTREMFLAVWVGIAVLIVLYLLGTFKFAHDSKLEHVGGARILFATGFMAVAFWLGAGLFAGSSLGIVDAYIPPTPYPGEAPKAGKSGTAAEELSWHNNFNDALAEAKKSGKNIFIDFTGYSCINCRQMELKVFTVPAVHEAFKGMVRAKLYTDGQDTEAALSKRNRDLQNSKFGNVDLPFYAIVSPDEKIIATYRGQAKTIEDYLAFLAKGK